MDNTPSSGAQRFTRNPLNEETTILTPVTDGTAAVDRIPVGRQKLWIIITSAIAVLLIAMTGLSIYLGVIADRWSDQVDQVKQQNYDLGQKVASEQAQVVDLQNQLSVTTQQLTTAQQRVLEQADELAQRDDNVEFYARQINDLTSTVNTASAVASALNRCIDSKTEYIGYLKDSSKYSADDLAKFETGVKTLCDNAVAANVQLQQLLAGSNS